MSKSDKTKLPHQPGTEVLAMTNKKNNSAYQPEDIKEFVKAGHALGIAGREIVGVQIREGDSTIVEIVYREKRE